MERTAASKSTGQGMIEGEIGRALRGMYDG